MKHVPVGPKIIRTRNIIKLERDLNGIPARFKVRLVAHGNEESDEVEYIELNAPVACIEAVRILLS